MIGKVALPAWPWAGTCAANSEGWNVQVKKNEHGLRFRTEEGRYDLEASVQWIGKDLLVAIWGGERPHIGAVALAQPRPSLKDPDRTSSTASVFCVVGHKEDAVVKKASEFLSAALNTRVVATAGIHWENLDEEGIRRIVQQVDSLVKSIAKHLGKDSELSIQKG
jgi:hypothetical protein